MDHVKSLPNLLKYCFCFMFWFFDHQACGNFSSLTRDWTCTPALEDKILTTGPPGKSQLIFPNEEI